MRRRLRLGTRRRRRGRRLGRGVSWERSGVGEREGGGTSELAVVLAAVCVVLVFLFRDRGWGK